MSHFYLRRLVAVALLSASAAVARAQTGVGIGTTTPNASAALDITSTTQGLLLPRLTQAQRDAIASPPGGLVIFQTNNTPGLYAYSGTAWVLLAADNLGNHTATQNLNLGANQLVGNGGSSGLSVDASGNVGIGTTGPLQKLQVSGSATVTNTLSIGANSTSSPLTVTGTAPITTLLQSGNTAGTRVNLTNTSTGATTWSLISTGSAASEGVGKLLVNDVTGPRLTLDGAGNMGVGITSPAARLDVNGTTRLRGLTTAGLVTTDASGNLGSATAASLDPTTASNGLTRTGTDVALGGTLSQNTTVALAGNSLALSNVTSQTITQAATSVTASVTTGTLGMGQSFTLPAGATVTKVDVYGGGGTSMFTFYQGAPGGTVLTSQSATYNTGQALTSIVLATPVTVGAAGTYSFSTGSNNTFAVSNTNPYAGGVLYDGTTATTTLDMKFVLYYTTPGTALYVGNSGGVGIGTSAPAATLHVAGTGSTVQLEGLSGTGTRIVTADANGNLSATTVGGSESTTASNGLTLSGTDVKLGGTLTGATTISTTAANPLTVNGAGAVSLGTGTGTVALGNATGATSIAGSSIALTGTTNINTSGAAATNLGTGGSAGTVTIGRTSGTVTLGNLAGTGTRVVTTSSTGDLGSATAASLDPTTASNGLTKTGNNFTLGGTLGSATTVALNSNNLLFGGTGNVGIGAAGTAGGRLAISPTTTEPKITLYDGNDAANHYGLGVSSSQLNYHVRQTTADHVFYATGKNGDGTELLRIKGSGRVGIGTSSPVAPLHVRSSGILAELLESSSTVGTRLALENTSTGGGIWQLISTGVDNGEAGNFSMLSPDGNARLQLTGAGQLGVPDLAGANNQIVTTDASGNLQLSGGAGTNIGIPGTQTLEFGAGVSKEANAGKIGYKFLSIGSLDIVGAGVTSATRTVKIWAEGGTTLAGSLTVGGRVNLGLNKLTGNGGVDGLTINTSGDITTDGKITTAGTITAGGNVNLGANKLVGNGGTVGLALSSAGALTVGQLAGVGTRMVTTDNTGLLSSTVLPTDAQTLGLSGSTLSISGGNSVALTGLSDNLGNHTATTTLNLNNNQLSGGSASNVGLPAGHTLELGTGVSGKEPNAGKIGYQRFSSALDIVGAGTTTTDRLVRIWAEGGTTFTGPIVAGGKIDLGTNALVGNGGTLGLAISSAGAISTGGALSTSGAIYSGGGLGLPGNLGPDPTYVGLTGNAIAFGHTSTSEDFIGYKNNTFYLKDSPGGSESADPNLVVGGNVGIGSGITTPTARLQVGGTVAIEGTNTLEFGAGVSGKEPNAGKVGYQAFGGNALDIVGAGTTTSNRLVKIWAEGGTTFTGPLAAGGKVDLGTNALVGNGGTTGLTITAGGAVTVGNLTGGTTRMVTATSAGVLSTQALPTDTDAQTLSVSGGNLSISNGNSVTLASLADNLGNHNATTNLSLNNQELYLRGTSGSDTNHGLGWYGTGKLWNGTLDLNGPALYGNGAGLLGTSNGGTKTTALYWNGTGQVGVGTTGPTSTFQVSGSEALSYTDTGSNTSFTLTSAHRTLRRFGTCSTITVPQASTCPGRLYTIINSNGQGAFTLTVTGGGSVYDDIANQTFSGTNAFPAATRLTIQSDGSGWIVVAR